MESDSHSVRSAAGDQVITMTSETAQRFREVLKNFLQQTECLLVGVVERGGALIVSEHNGSENGDIPNTDSVGVLAAGVFAATQMMAQILGSSEEAPEVFCHGKGKHIFLAPIGAEFALVTVFPEAVAVGVVRMQAREAVEKMRSDLKKTLESKTAYKAPPSGDDGKPAESPFLRYN